MSAQQGLRRLGSSLPEDRWQARHRALMWALVAALPVIALLFGASLGVTAAFVVALAIVATAAWRAGETRSAAFRSLLETLEEGVLMMDRKGRLAAANPSAARILGMDPARILQLNRTEA